MLDFLRTAGRLIARELRSRGADGGFDRGQRVAVERWGLVVDPRDLRAYLRTTSGTGIARFGDDEAMLPPTYPAVWEAGLALELLCHPRAPSVRGGIVHVASELFQIRALHAADRFRCRLELDRAESDPRGTRLHLLTRTWTDAGHLGTESRTVLLVRSRAAAGETKGVRSGSVSSGDDGAEGWQAAAAWTLRSGDGRRYARVSGDFNPIHLSRLTARPFGFRRPILHGFCLQAMVSNALIEQRFAGRPERLRRLRTAFRAPLPLPAQVQLLIGPAGGGGGRFRVEGEQAQLYAEGEFGGE